MEVKSNHSEVHSLLEPAREHSPQDPLTQNRKHFVDFFGINAKPMYVSLEHNSDYMLLAVARVQCGKKLPFANGLVSGSEHFFLN